MLAEKLLLEIEEAAAMLSIKRSLLYLLMARGEIRSCKIGRRRLIPRDALHEFVERRSEETLQTG